MKITLLQLDPVWENKQLNREKVVRILDNSHNSDLIILPEMSLTGFSMSADNLSETLEGETVSFYSNLAVQYNAHFIAGLIEKNGHSHYNSLLHFDRSGTLIRTYRKIHPFPFSEENLNYESGSSPVISAIDNYKIGFSICYDLRFPELYRYYGRKKVDAIINIANWPIPRIHHWRALLKARAIENLCYIIGVNRTGKDPKGLYNGFSSVFDPLGEEVVCLKEEEGIIMTGISFEKVKEVRSKFPFLNDMKSVKFWYDVENNNEN